MNRPFNDNILKWMPWVFMIINLVISITIKFNDLSHVQKTLDRVESRQIEVLQRLSCVEGQLKIK